MATFTNQASMTYNGKSILSNVVVGQVRNELIVDKTAVQQRYAHGDTITYVVSIRNFSMTPRNDLTVEDDLGAKVLRAGLSYPLMFLAGNEKYFVNGEPKGAPTRAEGYPLRFTGITVPAGGTVTIVYETVVTEFAPLDFGTGITNTVKVLGLAVNETPTATETIRPKMGPVLHVAKSIFPAVVPEGGILTYSFLITNSSHAPAMADGGAVVTDRFSPILKNITVTLDGTVLQEEQYTYNPITGEFSTLPTRISLAGATIVTDPDTGLTTVTPAARMLTVTGTV